MSKTVSDFLIERLHEWGVTRIYGYPGDGINGLMGALSRSGNKMDFTQVRHEEDAAFMACGCVGGLYRSFRAPLPPHISFKQAKAFAASMFKGDPDMWDVRERVGMRPYK